MTCMVSSKGLNRGQGYFLKFFCCHNDLESKKYIAVKASLHWLNNVSGARHEAVPLKLHSKFGLLRKSLKKASAKNLICPRMRIPGKRWKDLEILWPTRPIF
jgi:hypothetical protein